MPGPRSLDHCQEIPCYLLPVSTPEEGSLGRHFQRSLHTLTLKLSACIHIKKSTNTSTQRHTHREKSQACSTHKDTHTHTSWPGFKHLTGPRTRSPWILQLMFAFLPRAASLLAFKVSVFRDVPPGAGEIYVPFPAFFRRKRPRFF